MSTITRSEYMDYNERTTITMEKSTMTTVRRTFQEIHNDFDKWDNDPAHDAWTTDPILRAERKILEDEFNDWHDAHARGEC